MMLSSAQLQIDCRRRLRGSFEFEPESVKIVACLSYSASASRGRFASSRFLQMMQLKLSNEGECQLLLFLTVSAWS